MMKRCSWKGEAPGGAWCCAWEHAGQRRTRQRSSRPRPSRHGQQGGPDEPVEIPDGTRAMELEQGSERVHQTPRLDCAATRTNPHQDVEGSAGLASHTKGGLESRVKSDER
eukprot:scaffold1724_cov341-Pavlova_lutheri.AAC.60